MAVLVGADSDAGVCGIVVFIVVFVVIFIFIVMVDCGWEIWRFV